MNLALNPLEPDPSVRINSLLEICREVLPVITDNPAEADWQAWFYTYLLWHESAQLTTRRQFSGGPGRGLMQFEATTAWDTIKVYVLGPTKGLVARLAAAVDVDRNTVMLPALRAFADAGHPHNVWPSGAPMNQVERWLLTSDSFGLTLMQMQLDRYRVTLPPAPFTIADDPRDPTVHEAFADLWADQWWKGPASVRPTRIGQFLASARSLDQALA